MPKGWRGIGSKFFTRTQPDQSWAWHFVLSWIFGALPDLICFLVISVLMRPASLILSFSFFALYHWYSGSIPSPSWISSHAGALMKYVSCSTFHACLNIMLSYFMSFQQLKKINKKFLELTWRNYGQDATVIWELIVSVCEDDTCTAMHFLFSYLFFSLNNYRLKWLKSELRLKGLSQGSDIRNPWPRLYLWLYLINTNKNKCLFL